MHLNYSKSKLYFYYELVISLVITKVIKKTSKELIHLKNKLTKKYLNLVDIINKQIKKL